MLVSLVNFAQNTIVFYAAPDFLPQCPRASVLKEYFVCKMGQWMMSYPRKICGIVIWQDKVSPPAAQQKHHHMRKSGMKVTIVLPVSLVAASAFLNGPTLRGTAVLPGEALSGFRPQSV